MYHHKLYNKWIAYICRHTRTHTNTQLVLSWRLHGISSTLPPPHHAVCSPHYSTLAFCSLTSPLPVSNSNQRGAERQRRWRKKRRGHTTGCVSHTRLWLLHPKSRLTVSQAFVRDFFCLFLKVYHQWYIITHYFDWSETHFHFVCQLLRINSPFQAFVWWDYEICDLW